MSHVAFSKSNRATTLLTQAKQIDKQQGGLNAELSRARNDGDFERVREIKSELKQLDTMEDKVEGALKLGEVRRYCLHHREGRRR